MTVLDTLNARFDLSVPITHQPRQMLEHQREGIAKAKAEGAYKGRKPTARAKAAEVAAMKAEGRSVRAIAEALGISAGSVHGMLKAPAEV